MRNLRYKALPGLDAYDVLRDGELLGCVERVRVVRTVRRATRANMTAVFKWRYQTVGVRPSVTTYNTRKAAAEAMEDQFDMRARAFASVRGGE